MDLPFTYLKTWPNLKLCKKVMLGNVCVSLSPPKVMLGIVFVSLCPPKVMLGKVCVSLSPPQAMLGKVCASLSPPKVMLGKVCLIYLRRKFCLVMSSSKYKGKFKSGFGSCRAFTLRQVQSCYMIFRA